jgi:hypothetical protein
MQSVVYAGWGTAPCRPKWAQSPSLPIFSTPHRENRFPVTLRSPHHHPYALGVVGPERGARRVSPLRSQASDAFSTSPNETLAHVISLPISPAPVSARRVATRTPLHSSSLPLEKMPGVAVFVFTKQDLTFLWCNHEGKTRARQIILGVRGHFEHCLGLRVSGHNMRPLRARSGSPH